MLNHGKSSGAVQNETFFFNRQIHFAYSLTANAVNRTSVL